MKDYSLNVSIARERQDDDPEMLRNRYFGATEVRFWSVAWICTGLLAQAGWVADDRRLAESPRKREKPAICRLFGSTATGIRTPVSAVRGRRPSPLDDGGKGSTDEASNTPVGRCG